jgi:hypothetical protein
MIRAHKLRGSQPGRPRTLRKLCEFCYREGLPEPGAEDR